jgi:hypothetical protein
MTDDWRFWQAQLRGEEPQTTPGTPHAGFYTLRKRTTEYAPILGQRRNKVTTVHLPVAIWNEGHNWHCVIGNGDDAEHYTDMARIDETIFSRCCRNAIEYAEYERLIRDENE